MTNIGRPRSCECGECKKCKAREASRLWYQKKTKEERRAIVIARDPEQVRANDNARYYRNWEKRRAAADEYQKAHPEKMQEIRRRWNDENPEKKKAQITLNNAVRDRKVIKGPCEVCGETKRIHGHHFDYSKPLEVRWLCPKHHAELHRELRSPLRVGEQ